MGIRGMQAPTVSRETRTNFSGKKRHPDGKSSKDRNRAARSIKISTDDNGRHHVSFFGFGPTYSRDL